MRSRRHRPRQTQISWPRGWPTYQDLPGHGHARCAVSAVLPGHGRCSSRPGSWVIRSIPPTTSISPEIDAHRVIPPAAGSSRRSRVLHGPAASPRPGPGAGRPASGILLPRSSPGGSHGRRGARRDRADHVPARRSSRRAIRPVRSPAATPARNRSSASVTRSASTSSLGAQFAGCAGRVIAWRLRRLYKKDADVLPYALPAPRATIQLAVAGPRDRARALGHPDRDALGAPIPRGRVDRIGARRPRRRSSRRRRLGRPDAAVRVRVPAGDEASASSRSRSGSTGRSDPCYLSSCRR